jgi:hypothetical protein
MEPQPIAAGILVRATAAFCLLLAAPAAGAPHWGEWQVACTGNGEATYSAILWDIPFGASWEQACRDMRTTIRGVTYATPSKCVNVGPGVSMWGEFHGVPEPSCRAHWGDLRDDGCVPGAGFSGLRQYSAILWDVPPGTTWEDACSLTGATVAGVWHPHPAVCLQSDFSWLGSIVSIIAGAAVGVVTVNPGAGVAAGVAVDVAFLTADEATGGFGAMNQWGVFYAVDATCGELAGGGPGGGGGGETPAGLTPEAASCQEAIGRATGKLMQRAQRLRASCLDREAAGSPCDEERQDLEAAGMAAKADQQLTRACAAGELSELGFAGSETSVRESLIGQARFEADGLVAETYLAVGADLERDTAKCQKAIGRATGTVLKQVQQAHARCLAAEAKGAGCSEADRDAALARTEGKGARRIARACSLDELSELGLAAQSPADLVAAAVAHAEALIHASHPMPYAAKP